MRRMVEGYGGGTGFDAASEDPLLVECPSRSIFAILPQGGAGGKYIFLNVFLTLPDAAAGGAK